MHLHCSHLSGSGGTCWGARIGRIELRSGAVEPVQSACKRQEWTLMRGGGTRGGPHSAWTVARLQRIGNWGRADEGLGRRWEDVGLLPLARLVNEPRSLGPRPYTPTAILA